MSTREKAYKLIDLMTDEQVESFIGFIGNFIDGGREPNTETLAAFEECERMLADSSTVTYNVYDALEELKK